MDNVVTNGSSNGFIGVGRNGAVLFEKSIDKRMELSMFMQQIRKQWSDEDYKRARDLQKYVLDKEDAWVLDKALLDFVGDVLMSISEETKFRLMKVFSTCALKDSFVQFLNLDRERRFVMNYANKFSILSLDEQKAVSLFFCHLFSNSQNQKWAMYFSEWKPGFDDDSDEEEEGEEPEEMETTSNARITCKIARLCLQNLNPTLQKHGAAIAYNIATRNAMVMQRPSSIDETENGSHDTDMMHSSLQNGGTKGLATLRAYDAVALELSLCMVELLNKGTFKLTEEVLSHVLAALVNFIPVIKSDLNHFHSSLASDLQILSTKKLSESNEKKVKELLAQL